MKVKCRQQNDFNFKNVELRVMEVLQILKRVLLSYCINPERLNIFIKIYKKWSELCHFDSKKLNGNFGITY